MKLAVTKVLVIILMISVVPEISEAKVNDNTFLKLNPVMNQAREVYHSISGPLEMPDFQVFYKAYAGYNLMRAQGKVKNDILSIIDFSRHSSEKRFWIIDMRKRELLFFTYAAHGRGSGNGMGVANKFSNTPHSLQSSLGFYLTGETYYGKHGLSLNLDGQERGINDKARQRRVVIHGADYATASFVKKYGRLGRSYGCPAVPQELHKPIINTIKDKSVLFIHHPDQNYHKSSEYMKKVVKA